MLLLPLPMALLLPLQVPLENVCSKGVIIKQFPDTFILLTLQQGAKKILNVQTSAKFEKQISSIATGVPASTLQLLDKQGHGFQPLGKEFSIIGISCGRVLRSIKSLTSHAIQGDSNEQLSVLRGHPAERHCVRFLAPQLQCERRQESPGLRAEAHDSLHNWIGMQKVLLCSLQVRHVDGSIGACVGLSCLYGPAAHLQRLSDIP
mmetsp:Transcript_64259/g.114124  ORF Transcript_64259/g.114124 Transcript_64259/m.114124 type:complete len:205 (+) Transcript_64259:87-701(+)